MKKKIKIIKIEIGEAPSELYVRQLERVKPKPLKLTFLDDAGLDPWTSDTLEREVYPIQRFAYNSHWEEFYIQDKDMKAFEELVNGYVNQAKRDVIGQLQDYYVNTWLEGDKKVEHLYDFLVELKKKIPPDTI